jgi:mono/diheme cytochrome c family protein
MISLRSYRRSLRSFLAIGLLCAVLRPIGAQTNYTATDSSFTFQYPRRWKIENKSDKLLITAPDGSHYTLQRDTITPVPTGAPVNSTDLKATAAKIVAPLLDSAEFVSAQSVPMDHGAGATFRFKQRGKSDDAAKRADVWIGVIGKHTLVLLPEKAGQSSQTIGLSVLFESVAFADALRPAPKAPPARTGAPTPVASGSPVDFHKQIQPLLAARCQVCHNPKGPSGRLDVTSFADFIQGGKSGPTVVAGKPDDSILLDFLTGKRKLMPLGGPPLSDDDINLFRRWIAQGAKEQPSGAVMAGDAGASPKMEPDAPAKGERPGLNNGKAGKKGGQGIRQGRADSDSGGPALLEAYSGHLAPNDSVFTLRLMRDGSAKAEWIFSPQITAQFVGTYTGKEGNYYVTLTQFSGANPYRAKTLNLDLRSHGAMETGTFTTDTATARRPVADLELTEVGVPLKGNSGNGGTNGAGMRPNGRRRRP